MLHTFVVLAYKQSEYLENCIKSVLHQKYKSEVIIATSTPNDFIYSMAKKYNLKLVINQEESKGIGYDFDFAINCSNSELVTIAHQDDVYDYDYSYRMIEMYKKNVEAIILFSDYYEIRNNEKVVNNINLKIKRLLLFPIRNRHLAKTKLIKRLCLSFGDAICCPAVTFVKHNIPYRNIFSTNMKLDIDWYAWERLSRVSGSFVLVNSKLMGHRVHENSETSKGLSNNIRSNEDYIMFCKFWPKFIAKILTNIYKNSEKSNGI